MQESARKLLLTIHLVASIGWIGALAVFLAHALVGMSTQDDAIVRAACIAMAVAAWWVILPLSVTSFATGVIQAMATPWGLLRHYWIVFKLVLTTIATAVLVLKLAPIDRLAAHAMSSSFSVTDTATSRISLMAHAAGGLVILLTTVALAVYKPAGLIQRGPMPGWARIFASVLIVLALAIITMAVFGGHGPRMHS